jgi:amino acid adenylation domain-containing protein
MKISDLSFNLPDSVEKLVGVEPAQDASLFEERFVAVCRHGSERIALVDDSGVMTFSELDRLSAAIAHFILSRNFALETPVAVMCQRSRFFVAAALGVIRAASVYVPLDPALPLTRREAMLKNCAAPLLITDALFVRDAEQLLNALPTLKELLCLDIEHFEDAIESPSDLMSLELWHHVTADGADGSWKSFFNGQPLSPNLLRQLAENLLSKTQEQRIGAGRVLDVGSGGGMVARGLLSGCQKYTAVDLSRLELDRLEALAQDFPDCRVDTHQMEAIDIHLLPSGSYDLITMNSVIENFPGYNYLRRVLDCALQAVDEGGMIFLGGVWDLAKKEVFFDALRSYGDDHQDWSGFVRLAHGSELFVGREFFDDWAALCPNEVKIEFSAPQIASPELCDYRFDVKIYKVAALEPLCAPLDRVRHGVAALTMDAFVPPLGLTKNSATYIIYTSGTTGDPKGVVIEQGSLLNLAEGLFSEVYSPQWSDRQVRVALLASFSFDASIQQLVAVLLGGHSLYIVSDDLRRDPAALHHFLEKNKISVCDGTPSLFSLLTEYWHEHQRCSCVDTYLLGGEELRADLLASYFSIEGHEKKRLFNAYGPTECCVDSTLYSVNFNNHRDYVIPPIGYALPHVTLSVRDKNGSLLPEGIPGELWICGRGVSRGYYRDQHLTDMRFVLSQGERWYRTGDICRQLEGGLFLFAGREDQQVKVGGYRIEIGEVESILHQCPQVNSAIVVADDFTGSGVRTLASYIVPSGSFDPSQIRAFLSIQLPTYAIPTHFIPMPELPVTVSGKVDRKSLPSPVQTVSSDAGRALCGEVENRIADLWSQLLGRKVDDAAADFFELGGHSVLGIRLISLLEKAFNRRLSLSQLFKAPTIGAIADFMVKDDAGCAVYTPVIPISTQGEGAPIFMFHPVGGNVLCYRPLANEFAGLNPVYAVEAPGTDSEWPQLASVEAMAKSYLTEMLEVAGDGPMIFVGWSFGGLVAFEAAQQFAARGGAVVALILLDTVASNTVVKEVVQKDEAAMLARLFSEQLQVSEEEIRSRTGEDRLEYLIALGVENGLLPFGFGHRQMRRLLQTYHNNALAAARYTPRPTAHKALLIRPTTGSLSALNVPDDPLQGWGPLLQGGTTLQWISGNHESMLMPHSVGELGMQIKDYLESL